MSRRDTGWERGATLVEFAVLAPVLLGMLLGIVTGGLTYNRSISLNNAAREAARFGATLPVDGMSAWLRSVADVAMRGAGGALDDGEDGRTVCVAYVHPAASGAEEPTTSLVVNASGNRTERSGVPCYADGRPADEQRVQVSVSRSSELSAFFYSRTVTIESQLAARFERGS